jgi:RNA polymerase sigma-70 factor (ECF subfamily)
MQRNNHRITNLEDYHLPITEEYSHEKKELLSLVTTALELLPEDYRESFVLREYDGLSYQEIADLTQTSLATVKIRIFRAKQKIREILAPYLSDLSQ